jgi:hypothetical protein
MPAAAFALLAFFIGVSIVAGFAAWWAFGPRTRWGFVLPVLGAFAALYVTGHLLDLSVGPTVVLFGFDVALAFDIAVALVVAAVVALLQRMALQRLTPGGEAAPR